MNIHPIIVEAMNNGIDFTISIRNDVLTYIVDGFYKSGTCTLYVDDGQLLAETRYGQLDYIDSLYDLDEVNYSWWNKSKDRYTTPLPPDDKWEKLLLENGLIKKNVKTIVEYE